MSRAYVAAGLRRRVADQARYRCGYCLTAEDIVGAPMEIEHIVPESAGGSSEEDNLWLACTLCNSHKSDRTTAVDPVSGELVRLFDPRRQEWREHFGWDDSGTRIVGLTDVGRATASALNLNRPSLVRARRRWVGVGWHPPER